MSKLRVVGGLVASTSAAVVAAAFAVSVLPLQAAPAEPRTSGNAAIDRAPMQTARATGKAAQAGSATSKRQPAPRIIKRVAPVYPADAKVRGIRGVVILEAHIDTSGKVTDVKILRSIPALNQAAIDAVKQWQFEPPPTDITSVLTVAFDVDGRVGKRAAAPSVPGETRVRAPKVISSTKPEYPPDAKARGAKGSVILEARVDADGKVTDVKVLRSVDRELDQAAVDAVRQWRYAPLTPAKPFVVTVTVRFDQK